MFDIFSHHIRGGECLEAPLVPLGMLRRRRHEAGLPLEKMKHASGHLGLIWSW